MTKIINTTEVQYLIVDSIYANQRLDNFLISRLKGLPKTRLYRLLRKGEIRVNKKRIKPDYRVQGGDNIRIPPVRLGQVKEVKVSQEYVMTLKSRILYEDEGFLILNKPAGTAVHGGSGINLGIIEALRECFPNQKSLELVHRLDKDTSGCLLIAKKPRILKYLHEIIREGNIQKTYIALVKGNWPRSAKLVDAPLYKNQLSSGERIVKVSSEGKPSLTQFKVLKRLDNCTLIEAQPVTGRTHQIRVHAAYTGHPLAADEKYGDKEFNKWAKEKGAKRLFLHAIRLQFTLPDSQKEICVEAPLPQDLDNCLNTLTE
ncbi:MAG: Ribosomal large subunit pseudouridine synthase C [Legionellaceae bacterium]